MPIIGILTFLHSVTPKLTPKVTGKLTPVTPKYIGILTDPLQVCTKFQVDSSKPCGVMLQWPQNWPCDPKIDPCDPKMNRPCDRASSPRASTRHYMVGSCEVRPELSSWNAGVHSQVAHDEITINALSTEFILQASLLGRLTLNRQWWQGALAVIQAEARCQTTKSCTRHASINLGSTISSEIHVPRAHTLAWAKCQIHTLRWLRERYEGVFVKLLA